MKFSKIQARLQRYKAPVIIILAGMLLTTALSWKVREDALEHLRQDFASNAATRAGIITNALQDHLIDLDALRRFYNASIYVDRREFKVFVASTLKTRPGIQAFEWIPRVSLAERPRFEAEARRDGLQGYQFYQLDAQGNHIAAAPRKYYYPVYYVEPLAGNEPAVGFDLGSNPARLAALEKARDTGQPTATERITLVQETASQAGFLIYLPVYRPGVSLATVEQRRLALLGFGLGVFRAGDTIKAATRPLPEKALLTELLDLSAPADKRLLCCAPWEALPLETTPWRNLLAPRVTLHYAHPFTFAGRHWQVNIVAAPAFVQDHISLSYWLIPPLGIGLTLLLALYLGTLLSHKERAENLVAERTTELQSTTNMLSQIIDIVPQTIFWKDRKGVFRGCNSKFIREVGLENIEEIIGKTDDDLPWSKEDGELYLENDLQVMAEDRPQYHAIKTLNQKDGDRRWIDTTKIPIHALDGTVIGVLGVFEDITARQRVEEEVRLNESRLAGLSRIYQYQAASIHDLLDYALDEALALTASKIGYIYFYDETTRQFTLNSWSKNVMQICTIADPSTIYQLEKTGIWGEAVRQARPIMVNDFQAPHPLKRGYPEGHAPLYKYLTIPVFSDHRIVAVVGVANKAADYDDADVGQLTLMMNAVWKIVERLRAEVALRESEARFRDIAETTEAWIWEMDAQGRFTYSSPMVEHLLEYHPEEMLNKLFFDFFHPDDREERKQAALALFAAKQPIFEFIHRDVRKDGGVVWLSTTGVPRLDEKENLLGYRGINTDITARRQAEEALRKSEAQYRLLAENVIDVIWTMDLHWKFTYVSPSCESLTGYRDEELVGLSLDQLLTPHSMDLCKKTLAELLSAENQAPPGYPNFLLPSLELRIKDGSSVYIEVKGSILTDSQGQPGGMMGVTRDITERKQLEEQFLQAQKMEAVGTLAGGIAHDFNNILTAILGNIGLAMLDGKIGPRVQDRLAQAEQACLRAQALSQQLLTFAKGGAPVRKLCSVAELLTESTAFACVGSPVRCETTFPDDLWWLEADPGQIGQVFQNLTINAIQAMPTGGTMKVWAENLTLGTESDLPLSAGRYIKISVQDQGMGIPAEHLPRIFDPYLTTKQKGSGLGLASAYAIIKKHHGHIAVESKPKAGTTFYIYLPAVEPQASPQPEEDREPLVGKGKILVMDDEEMVRVVLGRMLARLGYEAEFAGDGREAIEMFVQAQGSGQAFAAAILDLTVPGGMGGKEALAKLLEIDPRLKAVVSSGYSDDPIMADFQEHGFSGVIPKPYRISELGKILNQVIMKEL